MKYDDTYAKDRETIIQEFLSKKGGEKLERTQSQLNNDDYLDDFHPLEIKVYGGNFERAFKMFRSLVQKERILSLYKEKQTYEKPSVKKRRKQNEMRQKRMELEARNQKILSGEFEKELEKKQKLKEEKRKLKAEQKAE